MSWPGFTAVIRRAVLSNLRRPHMRDGFGNPRSLSSASGTPMSLAMEGEDQTLDGHGVLRSRIFRLRFPKRSATAVLDKWVAEGRTAEASVLRQIARDLKRNQRYKHALEVFSWMESQHRFKMSASDQAVKLFLITKVHNTAAGEAFYNKLSGSATRKAAGFHLLHCFVMERNLDKAEALMAELQNHSLVTHPHLLNEMMKLYMAIGKFEKVCDVILYMKLSGVPLNVLSYNLWMNSLSEVPNINLIEKVHDKMLNDRNVEIGWSTYCTLASAYIRCRLPDRAFHALRLAETKLSPRNRLAYTFIMTIYSALNDRDGVLRLWESGKRVPGRITCTNYMAAILCFVKVGDIGEAEKVFGDWESEHGKYDIRVSNVLLGAYVRSGWMDKAEALHLHTLRSGGIPNYKTWEILMEGWSRTKQMEKALEAMKKGLSMLPFCSWRPSEELRMAIMAYFEE